MSVTAPMVRSQLVEGRVLSNKALTSRLHALRIELPQLPFVAGQFVRLELTVGNEKVAKPYSLVNPPDDPVAEVLFNTVPGGVLSNALAALQVGDAIAVSQPAFGFFTLDETPRARDLWLIATGTGLGPFLSILRTELLWQRYENVVLVHGVPLVEELVYQDLINTIQRAHQDNFHYISCVSREDNPLGFKGRVTQALTAGELERRTGLEINAAHSAVMLCGSQSMITDMRKLLEQRGLRKHLRHSPGQIVNERYF